MVGLEHYLVLGATLFALGVFCVLSRRNAIGILVGVELILNSANINFVAFSHYVSGSISGQIFGIFVIILAAAEAAVALALVLAIFQTYRSIDLYETNELKQ